MSAITPFNNLSNLPSRYFQPGYFLPPPAPPSVPLTLPVIPPSALTLEAIPPSPAILAQAWQQRMIPASPRPQPQATQQIKAITPAIQQPAEWDNRLKPMLQNGQAVVYALNIRTFGAHDDNHDGQISPEWLENGTFSSATRRLDELAALGVNAIHLLPVSPCSQKLRLGVAGSLYAPSDYHQINPELYDPNAPGTVVDQARQFVEEAHKRGIHVMADVPSCASRDLAEARPDLIAFGPNGEYKVPPNWIDIVMFRNNPELVKYYEGYFDLMVNQVGVDGFRVDVARARPDWFWQYFLRRYPNLGWLAESYVEEAETPPHLKAVPADRPYELLKDGFDAFYGQLHIFPTMPTANDLMRYVSDTLQKLEKVKGQTGAGKTMLGSFLTHDDPSLMHRGGLPMYYLASGLMCTLPNVTPYILDGFTTAYDRDFDIFNFSPRPVGKNPEVGEFLRHMLAVRRQYENVLTSQSFTPLEVTRSSGQKIFAFLRQDNGRSILVLGNTDVNARHQGTIMIPGLNETKHRFIPLAPSYGRQSQFNQSSGELQVDLGPGRFHAFEVVQVTK